MVTLSRFFLASYAALFLATLCVALLAITVVELLVNLDEIVDGRSGLGGALSYLLIRLPSYYLRDLVPVASFAAAFFCLGLPARRFEITAVRAGGIAPQRLAVPILLAATLLSVASLLMNETLVLGAAREAQRLESGGDGLTLGRGSFWYHTGNTLYNARDADADARLIRGVSVYELDPAGRLARSVRAPRVYVAEERRWELRDATVRWFEPGEPAAPPRVERRQRLELHVAESGSRALLGARAATLPLQDLLEFIEERQREGRAVTGLRARFHGRLAEPFAVLLFALFAIPVGISVERTRSLAVSALHGVLLVTGFYATRLLASVVAARAQDPALALLPWIVVGGFGALGALRFARIPR